MSHALSDRHRSEALMYLFTVGSKAVILSKMKSNNSDVILQSMDEENTAKEELFVEESTRIFKRSMAMMPGVEAEKRERGGNIRVVSLRYVKIKGGRATAISWKSKRLGRDKYFDLSSVSSLRTPSTSPNTGRTEFIRLHNNTRHLDVRFKTKFQEHLFLYSLSRDRML